MAYEGNQYGKWSGVANSDLSGAQYKFVKLITGGNSDLVDLCSGVTDIPFGVLQNNPKQGEEAEIVIGGVTKVSSDAALARGNEIGTSADGQAAVYVPGTDTTKRIVGIVLQPSGAADELATAYVMCVGAGRGA